MTSDTQKIIRELADSLNRNHIPFTRMYVFGSTARGTQHEWSDIDVGVVGPAFGKDRIEELVTLRRIAYAIDPALAPIPLRPEDLEDRFSTIGTVIRREGQEVRL